MNALVSIFGEGRDLTSLQMGLRGVVVFFVALVMIRISGRRSFGQHTPFDACVTVLLGALLSRAIVGASPFVPVLLTGIVLVLVHRGLAMLCVQTSFVERLVSGSPRCLFTGGLLQAKAMRKGLVSQRDVRQAIREHAQLDDFDAVESIVLEDNGVISVVKKSSTAASDPPSPQRASRRPSKDLRRRDRHGK